MTNKLATIEKELNPIIRTAKSITIGTPKDMEIATEVLSTLNKFVDKVTTEKEKVTKPLLLALKNERARWSPVEKAYEAAIEAIRSKMSEYQTNLVTNQRKEEQKIADRVGTGKGKIKLETAIKKMEEVEKAIPQVISTTGIVSFREIKTLNITNEQAIPREYLVVDEKKVLETLKAGVDVPGAEIKLISVPSNYR